MCNSLNSTDQTTIVFGRSVFLSVNIVREPHSAAEPSPRAEQQPFAAMGHARVCGSRSLTGTSPVSTSSVPEPSPASDLATRHISTRHRLPHSQLARGTQRPTRAKATTRQGRRHDGALRENWVDGMCTSAWAASGDVKPPGVRRSVQLLLGLLLEGEIRQPEDYEDDARNVQLPTVEQ